MSKWIKMKVGDSSSLLRLLDSKLAIVMETIIEQAHDNGIWVSSEEVRGKMCVDLDISPPTYFRYVKTLVDKGVLLQQNGRGIYKINPRMITPAE
jgi:hypothetical protein